MEQKEPAALSTGQFALSMGVFLVVFLFLSGSVVPTVVNDGLIEGNFIRSGVMLSRTQPWNPSQPRKARLLL